MRGKDIAANMMTDVEVADYLGLSLSTMRRWRLWGDWFATKRSFRRSIWYSEQGRVFETATSVAHA